MFNSWKTRTLAISVVVAQHAGVMGQTTNAVCLPYFDWMSNSQHQSPCLVGANLLAVCNGGSYNVEALPNSTHYLGPLSVLNANDCQCNTATYSVMSACAACQGRSYLSWSEWTANCPSVSSGFPEPLPTGLYVPGWAFLDPRPLDNFDQIQAQKSVNLTESVVLPPPTSTSSATKSTKTKKPKSTSSTHHSTQKNNITTTSSTSTIPSNTSPAAVDNARDKNRAKMVSGIVAGVSVVGLSILAFIIWFIHFRVDKKKHGIQLVSPIEENPPMDLERGPRVVIEEPRDYEEDKVRQHMQRYIEATVHTPSSSATETLPSISVRTTSEPSSPVRATHNRAT